MTPLLTEAPAKLNLTLRVVGRRDDGYHLLESELVTLELADRLLLLPGCSGLRVEGADPGTVPLDRTNLAWRGLVAGLGEEPTLHCLTLEKLVPVAAGLGGGSSDAAAAWRLGRAALGADAAPTAEELVGLAAIGADVPFFAAALPAARVEGIGERVAPLTPRRLDVVLVHPPFGLATADVFAALRPQEWGSGRNDLLAPARRLLPELDDLMDRVRRAGGEPQLTGSGPTIFTVADGPDAAARLAQAVGAALHGTGARVTLTRTRTDAPRIETIDEVTEGSMEEQRS